MEIIILLAILGAMGYLAYKKIVKILRPKKRYTDQPQGSTTPTYTYAGCYQRKYLFTKNEYYEFKKLSAFAKANYLEVFAKVRLLDLIEPIPSLRKNKELLWKIQAKHVDFIVTDTNFNVKAIIELDDSSHNRQDRIERDQFVNEILRGAGYTVIRTASITPEVLQALKYMAYKNATGYATEPNQGNRTGAPEQNASQQA